MKLPMFVFVTEDVAAVCYQTECSVSTGACRFLLIIRRCVLAGRYHQSISYVTETSQNGIELFCEKLVQICHAGVRSLQALV